jgi:hypothetical protein
MRIAAAVLVILGSILTVTIVWLAIGLLLMGFGLLCGLIADHRDARSSNNPAKFANGKPRRARVRGRSPMVRFRDASPLQPPGAVVEGSFAFARNPLPEALLARRKPAANFEDYSAIPEQAISAVIDLGARHYAQSKHAVDLENDEQSLLPAMMSLVAQAVGQDAADISAPISRTEAADLSVPLLQDLQGEFHHVVTAGVDWAQTADDINCRLGEEGIDISSRKPVIAHPSPLILKELAEMDAVFKENVEEAEQLIELLNQMSMPKLADHDRG